MKIDKTRFLVLTSGLAAASAAALIACSSSTTKTDNPNNGTDSGTTDSGGNADTGATGDGGGDAAVACLSDKGPEPFCSAEGLVDAGDVDADTDGGDAGSQQPSACPEHCDVGRLNFKTDVAADIKKCLDTGTMGCDNAALLDCEAKALAKTCDDPTVTALCTPVVAACADAGVEDGGVAPTQESCEKLMKGLNQIGRDSFTGCVQEGILTCGQCLDGVTKNPGG